MDCASSRTSSPGADILKVRLIPSLLLRDGRMVKGVQFDGYRDVGHPVTTAKVYDAQGADELLFLDITATAENRRTLFDVVSRTADECFMPLTVGGGVRTLDDVRALLLAGADKVSINTQAVLTPGLVRGAAERFGSQAVVAAIDVKGGVVWTHGGHQPTSLTPVDWARQLAGLGAGEIVLTSVDRDGTRTGYDIDLVRAVADAVTVPVIASGGAGRLDDLVDGIRSGHASAVAAASIFHFTDQSVIKARAYMRQAGLEMRIA
jgi:imidazole glycerol-phosphate synthase subunit HisF